MNSIVLTANVQPNLDVNYIGMDVHSDNVVVCVRRNTINSSGQLVGKTIKTKKVVIKNSQEPLVELLNQTYYGHLRKALQTCIKGICLQFGELNRAAAKQSG